MTLEVEVFVGAMLTCLFSFMEAVTENKYILE